MRRSRSPFLLTILVLSVLLEGCVSSESALISESYYVTLGSSDTPLVAAVALAALVDAPETRVAILRDVTRIFIAQENFDNASLLLEDAAAELRESATFLPSFLYPIARSITIHTPLQGSLERANLYLDIVAQYQYVAEEDSIEELLRAALNEILLSEQGYAHHRTLMRFLVVARSVSLEENKILTKPIEAILVYRYPVLYSELLKFLLVLYSEDEQTDVTNIFREYIHLLLLEYRDRYDWLSLAIHYSLREIAQIPMEDIERIRSRAARSAPRFTHDEDMVSVIARLSEENDADTMRLYRQIEDQDTRCKALLSMDGAYIDALLAGDSAKLLPCVRRRANFEVPRAYLKIAAAYAIRTNDPARAQFVEAALRGAATTLSDSYLHVAENFADSGQVRLARMYIGQFSALYDQEIGYNDAMQFASLYIRLYSITEALDLLQQKRGLLIKIAILIALADEELSSGVPVSDPIIRQSIERYLL